MESPYIDLTLDESPPSLPRPTIAGVVVAPRRALRDGSTSTTTSRTESSNGDSLNGDRRPDRSVGRRTGSLTAAASTFGRGRTRSRGHQSLGVTLGVPEIKEEETVSGTTEGGDELGGPSEASGSASASITTIKDDSDVEDDQQGSSLSRTMPSTATGQKRKRTAQSTDRERPSHPIPVSSDSDVSNIEVVDAGSLPPSKKLDKGKGKAKEVVETPEPEENLLAFFQCPICLAPPMQAVLTPCGHIMCGACLFSTLKSHAIRHSRKPLPVGAYPTMSLTGRRLRSTGKPPLKGRILQGHCPVCRHEIEGGMGTVPGEGGVKYLEVRTITEV